MLIPDIQNLFFTAIVRGIDDEIQKHGYTVLLANSDGSTDRERVYLNTFRAEGVAGLLVVPSQDDERIYRDFLRTGVPLVVLDRTVHLPNVDLVSVTNAEGSAQAVAHLVELGHRRIAMIAGPHDTPGGKFRLVGFEEEMGDGFDPVLVEEGDYSQESGALAMARLLERTRDIDAVFAASDMMAAGAIATLRKAGLRVPDDIAVAGFDDSGLAATHEPALTTMRQPWERLSSEMVSTLLDVIAGAAPEPITLPTTLVVRDSA